MERRDFIPAQKIPAALTPDEWTAKSAAFTHEWGSHTRVTLRDDGTLDAEYEPNPQVEMVEGGAPSFDSGSPLVAPLIALANHALPDHDPRKIILMDAVRCDEAAAVIDDVWGPSGGNEFRMLAAKLRALLPPEG